MEATTVAGLIGAGSAASVAIIAAVGSAYTAHRKLDELRLAHAHKLDEIQQHYLQTERDNQKMRVIISLKYIFLYSYKLAIDRVEHEVRIIPYESKF